MKHRLGKADDLRREGCRIVDVDGRPIGVISVGPDFYAVHDRCPHMGASLCTGSLGGTFVGSAPHELVYGMDDRVIRCPWHGWEFALETGRSLLEPSRFGLKTFSVTVEGDEAVLHT